MREQITEGPLWLENLLIFYLEFPWRKAFDTIVILALAFEFALGMLALFQPLYDIAKWKGWL